MSQVRTRFAPSPTGHLHIGGVRTALFNYLYARHTGGAFLLRIEDTDLERSKQEYLEKILEAMRWLGLDWDEGPFYQTQRFDLYREHAERLLAEGKLYRCYCSAAELEAKREAAMRDKRNPGYDRTCRGRTDAPSGQPFVLRLKAPVDGDTVVRDLVRGHVTFANSELDDLVVLRSDGSPTYNFCVVVDDALMRISHVIRGEDHLANTPKQIQIYRALGFEVPEFAHVPMILGADRTKLSKRHGAASALEYREAGFLPDALVNYLARLGWSAGDQEIFSRSELVEKFSLDHLGTSAAAFDPEKLTWLNGVYFKQLSPDELARGSREFLEATGLPVPDDDVWIGRMVETLRERAHTFAELAEKARFYLSDGVELEAEAAAKHLTAAIEPALTDLRADLAGLTEWNAEIVHGSFDRVIAKHGLKLGKLAQPARVALTGTAASPGIFEVLDLLGRDRSLRRLDAAIEYMARSAASGAQS